MQATKNEEMKFTSYLLCMVVGSLCLIYTLLQRHSHGRIRLNIANAKSLVKHSFFSFDLIFFFFYLLPLVCKHANRKRFLSVSCQLPSCSTVSHTQKPKKNLFLCSSLRLFKFTFRFPDSGFSPTQWDILLFQVLTFDGRGVSGHANHIAIHKAVRYWLNFKALISFLFF